MRRRLLTAVGAILAGLFIYTAANGGNAQYIGGALVLIGCFEVALALWALAGDADNAKKPPT